MYYFTKDKAQRETQRGEGRRGKVHASVPATVCFHNLTIHASFTIILTRAFIKYYQYLSLLRARNVFYDKHFPSVPSCENNRFLIKHSMLKERFNLLHAMLCKNLEITLEYFRVFYAVTQHKD